MGKEQKEDLNDAEQQQLFKIEQLRLRIESFKKKGTADLSTQIIASKDSTSNTSEVQENKQERTKSGKKERKKCEKTKSRKKSDTSGREMAKEKKKKKKVVEERKKKKKEEQKKKRDVEESENRNETDCIKATNENKI